jgi:hypothetical protein
MSEPTSPTMTTTLHDANSDRADKLVIRLVASPHGISLFAEGYGDHPSEEGHGTPVYLELYEGELRLVVWADINVEEPTHIIVLGAAKERCRRPGD